MARLTATTDTDGLEARFFQEARRLQANLNQTAQDIGVDSELIFSSHALRKSGRLSRGVESHAAGSTVLVTVHAKNPKTGYDYVGVTRFGHRKMRIKPKHAAKPGRYLAPIPGVGPRWVKKRAALQTPFGFFASVRGFKPKGDWAKKALPEVKANARQQVEKLGHDIMVRLA